MTSSAITQIRRRSRSGAWLIDLLPVFEAYQQLEHGQRAGFIADLARETGQAENTLWRQLAAMKYLVGRGVALQNFKDRAPALMSIEAVARAGRTDSRREAELLEDLVAGKGSVSYFRKEAEAVAERRSFLIQGLSDVPDLRLSQVLLDHYEDDGSGWEALSVEMWPDRPLMPLVLIRARMPKFALLRVEHDGAMLNEPHFGDLFQGAVLRSLITCEIVVLCTDLVLDPLEPTLNAARPGTLNGFALRRCRLENDLVPPERNASFRSIEELVDRCRKPETNSDRAGSSKASG